MRCSRVVAGSIAERAGMILKLSVRQNRSAAINRKNSIAAGAEESPVPFSPRQLPLVESISTGGKKLRVNSPSNLNSVKFFLLTMESEIGAGSG